MAHVEVSPDAVAGIGSQVGAAASIPTTPTATVSPPAQDPVSVGVAQTFAARVSAIAEYSAAGGVITDVRADMVTASATGYQQQEQVNQASLSNGGRDLPRRPPPRCRCPPFRYHRRSSRRPRSVPDQPAAGPLATDPLRRRPEGRSPPPSRCANTPAELSVTASQLRQSANGLGLEWDSAAGREAASRVNELGSGYTATPTRHRRGDGAGHQGENFGRARPAIATPQQFDDLERGLELPSPRIRRRAVSAATPRSSPSCRRSWAAPR